MAMGDAEQQREAGSGHEVTLAIARSEPAIAVVGVACQYPGAQNPRQLWENVLARRMQFRRFPEKRLPLAEYHDEDPSALDRTYGRMAAVIDGFQFPWAERRIPQSMYEATDLVHWLALEVALAAVADAGYRRDTIPGEHTGVLVGNSLTGEITRANAMRTRWPFVRRALRAAARARGRSEAQTQDLLAWAEVFYKSVFPKVGPDTLSGGLSNTIAGRICNFLNLGGGGYTVDGACASSLLAVATASERLWNGDLDLALCGGVDISLDTFELIGFAKTAALTSDEMRVYDRRGSGFIPGEGCGFLLLKRLDDARRDGNRVYAVLRGWGISSDGAGTSITAPSPRGQARALARAYERAGYSMDNLHFIEGHGTGTRAGDRAELEGIALAMGPASSSESRSCGVTSVKSIIGHTKAAAGIAGLIKAVMAVNRRIIPPTANCREPHPIFDDQARALYPVLQGALLPSDEVVRAGVSGMGFGGINCHITLQSGDEPSASLEPQVDERALMASAQESELLVLTGDTPADLTRRLEELVRMSRGLAISELCDLSAKLGREVEARARARCAIIASRPDELEEKLDQLLSGLRRQPLGPGQVQHDAAETTWLGLQVPPLRVGLLFPGQGSQMLNMGRVLVERYGWARRLLVEADRLAAEAGTPGLGSLLYRPLDRATGPEQCDAWFQALAQTEHAQPAIGLASVLWLELLRRLGVTPSAVGGHSLGELCAFHAAGAFGFQDLIRLCTLRGQAMAARAEEAGAMASLRCSQADAEALLRRAGGYVVLANINGPQQVVVSGERPALEEVIRLAAEAGIRSRHLREVSNAFHSRLAAGAAELLAKEQTLPPLLAELHCRLFTSLDGSELKPGYALRPHFARQVIARVDFVSLVRAMDRACDLYLEVGPGRVLSTLTRAIHGADGPRCLPLESSAGRDLDVHMALAALFTGGLDLRWEVLYESRLVRPFTPASERTFVENPCERPFDVQGEVLPEPAAPGVDPSLRALLPAELDLSEEQIGTYLERRRAFLAEVIRADLKHTADLLPAQPDEAEAATAPPSTLPEAPTAVGPLTREALAELVQDEVSRETGFPRRDFSLGARLLDDLSLDSLRTGDFLARLGRVLKLKDPIDALSLANATLETVVEQLWRLISLPEGGPDTADAPVDLLALVLEETSRITGYPVESLDPDAQVESDLRLSTPMLRQLLEDCARRLRISIHVDLEPLSRRSLRAIAAILERMARGEPPLPSREDQAQAACVREFDMALLREPLPPPADWWGQRLEDDWQSTAALVLADPDSAEASEAMRQALYRRGAQVQIASFQEALEQGRTLDPDISMIIALLPQSGEAGNGDLSAVLRRAVLRLRSVTSIPPAAQAPRRRTTLALVQFGGGFFGSQAPFAQLGQAGVLGFGSSLHLEREDLRVRVLDFAPTLELDRITEAVLDEINTPSPFVAAGYTFEMERHVPRPRLLEPALYPPRELPWTEEDVVLVTGGGQGITAACALGVAWATRATMVLVGRTPGPSADGTAGSPLLEQTLGRYRTLGLKAYYWACDVSDPEAAARLVRDVQREVGEITGLIHGAGLNIPRPAATVSPDEALREVGPKVLGAGHLLHALASRPPKLIIGFSSIIGLTGMPGNAWYAFSNEALDLLLRAFAAAHPTCQTQSIAFGLWRGEGMGERMGSVEVLRRRGIMAISPEEGVRRFVHLFLHRPPVHQVVVTAQASGLDTWAPKPLPAPAGARFLETPVRSTPGVESVFHARLTLGQDPYLGDHQYGGAYLFPAVFGLEAMAQVVAHAAGRSRLGPVRLEDVHLSLPIKVDPQHGTEIRIRAEVQEHDPHADGLLVRAGVMPLNAQALTDHFSATFVLLHREEPASIPEPGPEDQNLDIRPSLDFYREGLLFQGQRFQQIQRILAVEDPGEHARSALFESLRRPDWEAGEMAFPETEQRTLLLGDPFFRDTLLQAIMVLVPKEACLPIYIKRLCLYASDQDIEAAATMRARVRLSRVTDRQVECEVVALDSKGNLLESLSGYTLHILQHRPRNPSVAELLAPDERDTRLLTEAAENAASMLGLELPSLKLRYISGIHRMTSALRRMNELPLLQDTATLAARAQGLREPVFTIEWQESGRPVVLGLYDLCQSHDRALGANPEAGDNARPSPGISISLSHDDRLCLATAGPGPQGCDIEAHSSRSREQWSQLLGGKLDGLLDRLLAGQQDSLDQAGCRLWSALEVRRKVAGSASTGALTLRGTHGPAVVFEAAGPGDPLYILTLPVELTWGPSRMVALAVRERPGRLGAELTPTAGYEPLGAPHAQILWDAGPRGQPVMMQRFYVTFKPAAHLSRTVYFAQYLFWAGEAREASAWPVLGRLAEQFSRGEAGGVTNSTHIRFFGEAKTHDQVEVRMWCRDNGGPRDSTMDLTFDFRRCLPDGASERLALMELRTTWVRILGPGRVEVDEYPDYYKEFALQMKPRRPGEDIPEALPEPLLPLHRHMVSEAVLFRAPPAPAAGPVLFEHTVDTSLGCSNIVGNIYFAQYHTWLGEARDRYFHSLAPHLYRGTGPGGELISLEGRLDHLQEAMPFDRLRVTMSLRELRETSARLEFRFHRLEPDGGRTYLAHGWQEVLWVIRDALGKPSPAPFPEDIRLALKARGPGPGSS